jgi:hypothetical protein
MCGYRLDYSGLGSGLMDQREVECVDVDYILLAWDQD